MNCPICSVPLKNIQYGSQSVDICTNCEGIWLDAGELEAISKVEKKVLDKLFDVFKK